jgi:hypothetical protein
LSLIGLGMLAAGAGCTQMVVIGVVETAKCLPLSDLDGNATFDKATDESIVVFGVSKIYSMTFQSGIDNGVSWHRDRPAFSATVTASDGFVVARLKPRSGNRRYAIARAAFEPGATDCYTFPHTSTQLTFDAPAGQVTYLGALTVEYKTEGGSNAAVLRADPSISKQQAIAYLARRYPGIKGEVVTGRTEWGYK